MTTAGTGVLIGALILLRYTTELSQMARREVTLWNIVGQAQSFVSYMADIYWSVLLSKVTKWIPVPSYSGIV